MTFDAERTALLHQALAQENLEAVLAWRAEEIVLTCGVQPHLGLTLCLYPRAGTPIVYAPEQEQVSTLPDHLTIQRYEPGSGSDPTSWNDLKSRLEADATRLSLRRIGYAPETGRQAPPGNAAEGQPLSAPVIAHLLEAFDTRPTRLLANQMLHKTSREIALIRIANAIAGAGLRTFYALLQPGRTEAEIAGQIEAAIQARSGRDGCGLARAWAYVQAGTNSVLAGTVSRSSGASLQAGDLVVLEMATCVDGYWSDLTRTGVAGTPTAAQKALLTAVRKAQQAALNAIRPGVPHAAIDRAARRVLEEGGYGSGFTHATGHHVGFRYHDPGPILAAGSESVLELGMIITVEPGVYGAAFGGGARFEDNVLVTADGSEVLSPMALIG